jgi:hypothetical protein
MSLRGEVALDRVPLISIGGPLCAARHPARGRQTRRRERRRIRTIGCLGANEPGFGRGTGIAGTGAVSKNVGPLAGDRGFESFSLQRGVNNEPGVRPTEGGAVLDPGDGAGVTPRRPDRDVIFRDLLTEVAAEDLDRRQSRNSPDFGVGAVHQRRDPVVGGKGSRTLRARIARCSRRGPWVRPCARCGGTDAAGRTARCVRRYRSRADSAAQRLRLVPPCQARHLRTYRRRRAALNRFAQAIAVLDEPIATEAQFTEPSQCSASCAE